MALWLLIAPPAAGVGIAPIFVSLLG